MLRLVSRLLAIGIVASCLLVSQQRAASADTRCQKTDALSGVCLITAEVPGPPSSSASAAVDGPNDTGEGAACYWDPAKQGLTNPPAGPVPCTSNYGYWSNDHNCYVKLLNPQPPAGDPEWQGHKPGDGAVYDCFQPPTQIEVFFWAQNPPPGSGTGPTPRQVALLAIKQMGLSAIQIGIAPKPGPNSIGIVGMPVWMWAANPTAKTVGPISGSATAGGITTTATATLLHIAWDMGDGSQVVCKTAGTPYSRAFGGAKSPDCGYVYTKSSWGRPNGHYVVTATSDWVVTWSGAGQTGTIRFGGLTSSTQITIGEAQVLVN